MSHYDISRWVDYARNLVPEDQRAPMEAHLNACTDCSSALAWLSKVVAAGAAARMSEPPVELVEAARSVFPAPVPVEWPVWAELKRRAAELTYSSLRDPLPAGTRTAHAGFAQVVYRSGPYRVDLRVEGSALVGQVSQEEPAGTGLGVFAVGLLAGKKVMAQAVSNEFGEFCLEYASRSNMRLVVAISKKSCIELPLTPLQLRERGVN